MSRPGVPKNGLVRSVASRHATAYLSEPYQLRGEYAVHSLAGRWESCSRRRVLRRMRSKGPVCLENLAKSCLILSSLVVVPGVDHCLEFAGSPSLGWPGCRVIAADRAGFALPRTPYRRLLRVEWNNDLQLHPTFFSSAILLTSPPE